MIALPTRGSLGWSILEAVAAEPGELAARRVRAQGITVCSSLAETLYRRERLIVEAALLAVDCKRLADRGLLARRAVRPLPHFLDTPADALAGRILAALDGHAEGLALGELARAVGQRRRKGAPTGYMARELARLYACGYLSPPAALWPSPAGVALIAP